jgi:hypothetical protein
MLPENNTSCTAILSSNTKTSLRVTYQGHVIKLSNRRISWLVYSTSSSKRTRCALRYLVRRANPSSVSLSPPFSLLRGFCYHRATSFLIDFSSAGSCSCSAMYLVISVF